MDDLASSAIVGFPERYAKFIDAVISADGRWAYALVLLNPDDAPYPMMVELEHVPNEWVALQASEAMERYDNLTQDTSDELVSLAMGCAPAGARQATLRVGDFTVSGAIRDGWYLLAIWHRYAAESCLSFE